MSSERQISANRRNAEKSTGPRTPEGKAAVARNALRHGLRAEKVLAFGEQAADFAAFLEEQRAALEPADPVEEQLVERIAFCQWRLRRVYRIEANMIETWHEPPFDPEDEIEAMLGPVFEADAHEIATLSRYETALDRSLNRAYVMLERRQAKRRGEFVPAPIAVSVTGFRSIARPEEVAAKNEIFRTKPILSDDSEAAPLPPPTPAQS
jgi:hypothetical protein